VLKVERAVAPLRVLLVLLFVAVLGCQTLALPRLSADMAREAPELADLRWPLLVVSVLGLLCVQVVIVCTWKLLTMVKNDRIFSDASLTWVDAIVWAVAVAWVLLLGLLVHLVIAWSLTGLTALLLLMLIAGAVLELLLLVMRALLRQATTLRTDMDAVI
jgi:hypothetical protein